MLVGGMVLVMEGVAKIVGIAQIRGLGLKLEG